MKLNPDDAMTKKNPVNSLANAIQGNNLPIPPMRVFMLQHSLYRHASFVKSSHGSMQEDIHQALRLAPKRNFSSIPFASPCPLPSHAIFENSLQHIVAKISYSISKAQVLRGPTPPCVDRPRGRNDLTFPGMKTGQESGAFCHTTTSMVHCRTFHSPILETSEAEYAQSYAV